MRIIDRSCVVAAAVVLATPAAAMDDQATYWRFDGRSEKRNSGIAPATEWAASAWIGDDLDQAQAATTPVSSATTGHIDNEGGTKGIDSRFFYSRLVSDFWDAKAGVRSRSSTRASRARASSPVSRDWHPTASMSMPSWASARPAS